MLTAWILQLMIALVPVAPWRETYEKTAEAIAAEALTTPEFKGDTGAVETAALLVAIAFRESSFDPKALGDCGNAKVRTPEACQSHGLFQISKANAPSIELLVPATAAVHAGRLVRRSFQICRLRPLDEQLGWYAAGGNGCREEGYAASRRRMRLAQRLLRDYPFKSATPSGEDPS